MTKHWQATKAAVAKGTQWEVGIREGSNYLGRTVCRVYAGSAERSLDLAKEVAEAVNRNRRVKWIIENELDVDKLLRDLFEEKT